MTSISATAFRKDVYNIIARANEDCAPIAITNTKGKARCSLARTSGQLSRRPSTSWGFPAWLSLS